MGIDVIPSINDSRGADVFERATAPSAEADALEAALRDMSRVFAQDYAAGRMGTQHNTFQHRSRVLRQLDAQLTAMRAPDRTER